MDQSTTCSVEGCEKKHFGRTFCQMHYNRVRKTGRTDLPAKATPEDNFWAKVNKTDGCWHWTAGASGVGYGVFYIDRKPLGAHRVSWELVNAPIPEGMEIDHLCFNTLCVKPPHLRLVTRKQNVENRKGAARNNKGSGVRGVYPNGGGWCARVVHNGKRHYFGTYSTIEEAEAVVIEARRRLFTHSQN